MILIWLNRSRYSIFIELDWMNDAHFILKANAFSQSFLQQICILTFALFVFFILNQNLFLLINVSKHLFFFIFIIIILLLTW